MICIFSGYIEKILAKWKPFFAWFSIESLIHENQESYYYALNASNTAGESTIFVEFMLDVLRKALQEIPKDSKKMTDKEQKRWEELKGYLQTYEGIKNEDVQNLLSVSEATAKRMLKKFAEIGLIEAKGERKARCYYLTYK